MPNHQIIAEIGSAHNGDIHKAKELIHAAKESGASTAKFQWLIADEIVSKHAGLIALPSGNIDLYQHFLEITQAITHNQDFYLSLHEYCEKIGINFLCSIFGQDSLSQLSSLCFSSSTSPIHPLHHSEQSIKIASPEINFLALIHQVAQLSPSHPITRIILSDGISTFIDMLRVKQIIDAHNMSACILRCVTQYPAKAIQYQLSRMCAYQDIFSCQTGISDHTTHAVFLPALACLLGSSCTEKHFTLNKHDAGLDDSFALTPDKFRTMVHAIQFAEKISIKNQEDVYTSMQEILETFPSSETHTLMKSTIDYEVYHQDMPIDALRRLIDNTIDSRGFSASLLPIYYTTRRSIFAKTRIAKGEMLHHENTHSIRSETNLRPGIMSEYLPIFFSDNNSHHSPTIQHHDFLDHPVPLYANTHIEADTAIHWHMLSSTLIK